MHGAQVGKNEHADTHTADGAVAISQPHHAWLSGELARAWGAPGFEVPAPRDALLCAIALHDIGWLDWDSAPILDAETGYPLQFDKVEATVHTKLWTAGVRAARLYGVLPALHISRHGIAIYDSTFDFGTARPEQTEAVRMFIRTQVSFQNVEIAKLAQQPQMASFITPDHLETTKRFLVAVDTLSLHLCWGVADRVTIDDVPTVEGTTQIVLSRRSEHQINVEPWPFVVNTLDITIEGKELRPVHDQADLDRMFSTAAQFIQRLTLSPARQA